MLEGRSFAVFTDHKPLLGALGRRSDPWSARQQRQLSFIAEFAPSIRYIAGQSSVVADTLSRPAAATPPPAPQQSPLAVVAATNGGPGEALTGSTGKRRPPGPQSPPPAPDRLQLHRQWIWSLWPPLRRHAQTARGRPRLPPCGWRLFRCRGLPLWWILRQAFSAHWFPRVLGGQSSTPFTAWPTQGLGQLDGSLPAVLSGLVWLPRSLPGAVIASSARELR